MRGATDGIVDARQRVERGEGEKEVARLGDRGQPLHRRRGRELAERLDGVEPHVGVRIIQRREQRVGRFGMGLRPERQRRLNPQIDVGIAQQIHQRRRHVDAGHRQQLEGAAEHAEIAMAVAQRRDQRVDQRRIAAGGERLHGRPPHLPVVVRHRLAQRSDAVEPDSIDARCSMARTRASGLACAELVGERCSRSSRSVTSSTVTISPTVLAPSRSAPMTTRCCIAVEA